MRARDLFLLSAAIWAIPASAGTVVVWGETFPLSTINSFYNAQGHTSSIATGTLDTVNLSGVNLLWAVQPADAYTPAEITAMSNYLDAGGRIAYMGEHGGFLPAENARITAAIAALGGHISINADVIDGGFHDATRGNGQILDHSLTAGVNTYNYAAFASLNLSGGAQTLMLGTNLTSVMMAYEVVGHGSIFLITDQNVWDNVNAQTNDNKQMFLNLLTAYVPGIDPPPGEVPEPATFAMLGAGLLALGLYRRSRA